MPLQTSHDALAVNVASPSGSAVGAVTGGVHGRNRLMGNSLLEIGVFGRRAGRAAALKAREVKPGEMTLAHVDAWQRELDQTGIETDLVSPILLPDYTRRVR